MSPAVVHFQYSRYANSAIMHLLHQNSLTQENMEMFLLKIDDGSSVRYTKENLPAEDWLHIEHPLISLCSSDFLNSHSNILIKKDYFRISKSMEPEEAPKKPVAKTENSVRKHHFVLMVGDSSVCKGCVKALNEMQKVVSMFEPFEQFQNLISSQEISFSVANVMRLSMENLIPGDLPAMVYLGVDGQYERTLEEKGEFKTDDESIGIFYFNKNRFGRMVQQVVNQPLSKVEIVTEYMNLATIRIMK